MMSNSKVQRGLMIRDEDGRLRGSVASQHRHHLATVGTTWSTWCLPFFRVRAACGELSKHTKSRQNHYIYMMLVILCLKSTVDS